MEKHVVIEQKEAEIRDEGRRAFEDGKAIDRCPHGSHTRSADLWRRGFANAQFGALASTMKGIPS